MINKKYIDFLPADDEIKNEIIDLSKNINQGEISLTTLKWYIAVGIDFVSEYISFMKKVPDKSEIINFGLNVTDFWQKNGRNMNIPKYCINLGANYVIRYYKDKLKDSKK